MTILNGILAKRKLKKNKERLEKSEMKKIKTRSSRVAIEFKIPSKHIFDGKEYRTFDWKTSISAAKKVAKEQREAGYKALFAEQWSDTKYKGGYGRKGWAVYIRK